MAAATRAAAYEWDGSGCHSRKVCRRCDRGKSLSGEMGAKDALRTPRPAFLTSVGGQAPGSLDADRQAPDSHAGMGDPRFEHGVIYLCSHTGQGAMGLIVNKPAGDPLARRAPRKASRSLRDSGAVKGPIHFGGPVETGRGFVLHSRVDYDGSEGTSTWAAASA